MRLTDARMLQREIREAGYHCVVPLGNGPDGYFARIFGKTPIDFHTRQDFRKHHAMRLRQQRRAIRDYRKMRTGRRTLSPIEIMIDRACGLA